MFFNDRILFQIEIGTIEYKVHLSFFLNFLFCFTYLTSPGRLMISICIIFIMITLHELGHALAARFLKYRVYSINVGFGGGTCTHEECYYRKDDIIIAWGGVAAQISSL